MDWDSVIRAATDQLKESARPLLEPTVRKEVEKRVVAWWVVVGCIALLAWRNDR